MREDKNHKKLEVIKYNDRDVYFGIDILHNISNVLNEKGLARVLVVTSPSVAQSSGYATLINNLESTLIAVYESVAVDVPQSCVDELTLLIEKAKPDAIISIGGGSAIDATKATLSLSDFDMPHIAIPTTLASAECTDIFGVINHEGVKKVYDGYAHGPRIIFYDSHITKETPRDLWLGTALRTLDHALERYYSNASQLENDTMCLRALMLIIKHLPEMIEDNDDMDARLALMKASFLSMSGPSMTCISHAIAHQIKSRGNNTMLDVVAVTQPAVLMFNSQYCIDKIRRIATEIGIDIDGKADDGIISMVVDHINRIITSVTDVVDLPVSLKEMGIEESELGELAEVLMNSPRLQYNPRPIKAKEEMIALLYSMF